MGADETFETYLGWFEARGETPYPHQEEAMLALLSGDHVVLATPTGSGKSMVAAGAHLAALDAGRRTFYTAPIKALVNEKFFALCAQFGADRVGMLTGDASVNPDAPIICCTAEVLANMALREGDLGATADIATVVMDEFHFYAEPDRGWAWQVPLLELHSTQFVLMSATLGDMSWLAEDLLRRTGRDTTIVDDAPRPVPLDFSWALSHLDETLTELVATHQAPVYVVHFTQAAASEHATRLQRSMPKDAPDRRQARSELMQRIRFGPGFGKTLAQLLRAGIGVHHAGMLPKYRRLVEQLAQAGLLTVICGTDTLGVGINVPIRTVLFSGLVKFDGNRQRVLRTREFQQIAGRAGRAGFDTRGYVVVQAPEHIIDNERAKAKAEAKNAANPKKRSKAQLKKPPPGTIVWNEQTFDKLVAGAPERLTSRMRVTNAMIINVLARDEDAFAVLRRLLTDNHEPPARRTRLARRALRLGRSLLHSGVVRRLDQPDQHGRRFVLTIDLPDDFALNQPLAHFALAALDVLDPEADTYPLDVLSVIEAVLEGPRQILMAQQWAARGEALAEMKADGMDYEDRQEALEQITWPEPLAELLEATYDVYRQTHPWLPEDALVPKSIVREMWEQGMSFTDLVGRFQLARSEGLVLRYLTDAYRTLRQTVPEQHRPDELELIIDWLGETVRQTDSSLLDEWEALTDPAAVDRHLETGSAPAPPPRPLSAQGRTFEVMVRNAMWRRVELISRDDVDGLAALEAAAVTDAAELPDGRPVSPGERPTMTRDAWDEALEAYYADHARVDTGPDARGPAYLTVDRTGREWTVRQTLLDPSGDLDWLIEAIVDLDASDERGEAVVRTQSLSRLDGFA